MKNLGSGPMWDEEQWLLSLLQRGHLPPVVAGFFLILLRTRAVQGKVLPCPVTPASSQSTSHVFFLKQCQVPVVMRKG